MKRFFITLFGLKGSFAWAKRKMNKGKIIKQDGHKMLYRYNECNRLEMAVEQQAPIALWWYPHKFNSYQKKQANWIVYDDKKVAEPVKQQSGKV